MKVGRSEIILKRGDITAEAADALVNAANSSLMGGGGVDGAIHSAGGPEILNECKKIRETKGRCPAGSAVITGAGRLNARFVVHAVGPIYQDGARGEGEVLRQAYLASLRLCAENGVRSVCFPSISTGAYRFPVAEAARIALRACADFTSSADEPPGEIRFILFSDSDLQTYQTALSEIAASFGQGTN